MLDSKEEGRSTELEAKVGILETLLLAAMSTNRELKLKLDEISVELVELDVARKVKARHAAVVVEMGAPISRFGNVANYVYSDESTQTHALASTYRHHIS
jgi:hypothetical protein